jgi:hypothetical protein
MTVNTLYLFFRAASSALADLERGRKLYPGPCSSSSSALSSAGSRLIIFGKIFSVAMSIVGRCAAAFLLRRFNV